MCLCLKPWRLTRSSPLAPLWSSALWAVSLTRYALLIIAGSGKTLYAD